jgi:hypothetical protein
MPESMTDTPMLTERFDLAYLMAAAHHRRQLRKQTEIPYVSHLLAVASLILEMGGTEDEAIGALLHDYVEDGGGADGLERIRRTFGEDVARIVDENSDTDVEPKPPWRERKEAYIASIAHKAPDALRVSLADKLHNGRAILLDYRTHGEDLWSRFKAGEGASVRWYYRALYDGFVARADALGPGAEPALEELGRVVDELDTLAPVVKGSRFQLQRAVAERRDLLDPKILELFQELDGASLAWRSPVKEDNYREYRDNEFLERIGRPDLAPALSEFWPARGPVWDGLAIVQRPGQPDGVLLVEAKAHPDELLKGSGSAAKAEASIDTIRRALARLASKLGVDADIDGWMSGPAYQHGNRLAHVQWLNEQGVDAWFVHVLFAGDTTHKPSTREQLEAAMKLSNLELGIDGVPIPRVGHVIVDAVAG